MSKCVGVFNNGKKCNYNAKVQGYCQGHYKKFIIEKDIKLTPNSSETTTDSSESFEVEQKLNDTVDVNNVGTRKIHPKVAKLIEIDKNNPEQKSKEWLALRKKMITASDIAAALVLKNHEIKLIDKGVVTHYKKNPKVGDQADKNKSLKKLYLKKCDPNSKEAQFKGNKYTFHGETHEDTACTMYCHKMNCEVIELGVIQHPKYSFLGASPDGINIENGTMLEIKVPYSREITGIPTLGYWMQMQIQMQCCGFTECDFVECNITEYESEEEFLEDVYIDPETGNEVYGLNKDGEMRGCTVQLIIEKDDGEIDHKNGKCCPMMLKSHDELNPHINKNIIDFMTENNCKLAQDIAFYTGRSFLNKVYWKCTKYSQVRVKRDDEWFKLRLPDLERVWNNICKFREEGLPESLQKPDSPTYSKAQPKESKPQLERNQSTLSFGNGGELGLNTSGGGGDDDSKKSTFMIEEDDDEEAIYERLLKERKNKK